MPRSHRRKTKDYVPDPGHENCQHSYKLQKAQKTTDHTSPWRQYTFRVHCLVTARWMKITVPQGWFWTGTADYGKPEVQAGTISGLPDAPNVAPVRVAGPRMPRGMGMPGMTEMDIADLMDEGL